jgi:hypothetical protein
MPIFRKGEEYEYIRDCLDTPAKDYDELSERIGELTLVRQGEYWPPPDWWLKKKIAEINQNPDSDFAIAPRSTSGDGLLIRLSADTVQTPETNNHVSRGYITAIKYVSTRLRGITNSSYHYSENPDFSKRQQRMAERISRRMDLAQEEMEEVLEDFKNAKWG